MKHCWLLVLCALFVLVSVLSCGDNSSAQNNTNGYDFRQIGLPQDYFPIAVGTEWQYDIELFPPKDPLTHEIKFWPEGNSEIVQEVSGRLLFTDSATEEFKLVLKVKKTAAEQGPLKYPIGVELEVLQDDLGIYEWCDQVFFAVTNHGRYFVNLVKTYSPDSPGCPSRGSWGSWGTEPGHSIKPYFFGEEPGTGLGLENSNESVVFVGMASKNNRQCLHFTRVVEGNADEARLDSSAGDIGRSFTEDMWFAKGVGLIKLEQRVGDSLTMTWTLKE